MSVEHPSRERRQQRQEREQGRKRRAHVPLLDPTAQSPSRDRFLARLGISLDELTSLCSNEVSGVELDRRIAERTTRRRVLEIAASGVSLSERAKRGERDAEDVQRHPELAALVAEQTKDATWGWRIPSRPWLASLDAPAFASDESEVTLHDIGTAYWARRRGDFSTEASFVQPVIERVDRFREVVAEYEKRPATPAIYASDSEPKSAEREEKTDG